MQAERAEARIQVKTQTPGGLDDEQNQAGNKDSINRGTHPARSPSIIHVVIPEGCAPGSTIAIVSEGKHVHVTVPPDALPGQTLQVQVQRPNSPLGMMGGRKVRSDSLDRVPLDTTPIGTSLDGCP
jgi:hypothetical protein